MGNWEVMKMTLCHCKEIIKYDELIHKLFELQITSLEPKECVQDIFGQTGKKDGEVRKGEKHFGGVPKLALRLN
ncbi:hypothetical protein H5410_060113 [Solanum commersonii]|uniref:Uncharacterized protein n=1 Tax=Solanum commersonii TaxID=4109 RepID=A0A9J5W473_SOLCO|nr:hypothetical protein H5410_060113 [Solanum commersonii]